MLLTLVVSSISPKVYRATTYVLISDSKINPDLSHFEWDYAFLPTSLQFVNNEALAAEAISHFHLDRPPYKLTPHRFVSEVLDAQVVKNTRLLQIDIDFPDPAMAADLANFMAAGAARINQQITDVDEVNIQSFMKSQLDEASKRFEDARNKSLDAVRKAQIEDRERKLKSLLDEKERASQQIEDLGSALAQSDQRTTSLAQSLTSEPSKLELDKTVLSDRFLEHAVQTLAPDKQQVLSAREEEVNPTRQELERELAESKAGSAADKAGIEHSAGRLAQISSEITVLASDLAASRSAVDESAENLKLAQEGYENASREYRNATVNVTARSQTLKQVSPATVPEAPIRPRILLNTLAAGLLSTAVLAGLILGLDRARQAELSQLKVLEGADRVGRYS